MKRVCEQYREYFYHSPQGDYSIKVMNPTGVLVRDSGAHCVQDTAGLITYIPAGWSHFTWMPIDTNNPIDF